MVACSRPSPGADWPRGLFSRDLRASGLAEAAEGPAFVRRSRHRGALGKMAPAGPLLPSGDGGWRGPSLGPAGRPAGGRSGCRGGAGPVASEAEGLGGSGRGDGRVSASRAGGGQGPRRCEGRSGCPGGRGPRGAGAAAAPSPCRVVGSGVNGGPGSNRPLSVPGCSCRPPADFPGAGGS